jgi:hypothetical protein
MVAVTQAIWYRQGHGLLSRTVPGLVVLARVDGTSVTLSGSGASVWQLLDDARTIPEIADDLASVYDVEPSQIATDIEPLLAELAASGFVVADA